MKLSELKAQIEEIYKAKFPESKIFVEYSSNIYSSIWIRAFIAGDKKENSSGYWDNDLMQISFRIQGENGQELPKLEEDSELPNLSIENHAKTYHVKPENKYLVYESHSVSFRKVKGDSEKILKSLDKFFDALRAKILEDYQSGRIHPNHTEIVKIKLAQFAE